MTIGPSEDIYPQSVYGPAPGQPALFDPDPPSSPSSSSPSPSIVDGPRIVELETLYRTVQRYLETHMLEGAEATDLESLRHAAWCVEHQRPLPGSPGTPLSLEEYEELMAQAHAALRPEEVEQAMSAVLDWVRDEDATDRTYEDETAKRLWHVVVTTAVAVAAWERGRTLPSLKHQPVEARVTMEAHAILAVDGTVQPVESEPAREVSSKTEPESSQESSPLRAKWKRLRTV